MPTIDIKCAQSVNLGIRAAQNLTVDGQTVSSGTADAAGAQNVGLAVGAAESSTVDHPGLDTVYNPGGMLPPVHILETYAPTSTEASHTFGGIDTLVANWDALQGVTSRHLVLWGHAEDTTTGSTAGNLSMQFNGDTGGNYGWCTTAGVFGFFSFSSLTRGQAANRGTWFTDTQNAGSEPYTGFCCLVDALNFSQNNNSWFSHAPLATSGDYTHCGKWADVTDISSIKIFPNSGSFVVGTVIHLGVIDERYLVERKGTGTPGTLLFNSIPTGHQELVAIGLVRSARNSNTDNVLLKINGDSTATNYFNERFTGSGSTVSATSANNNFVGVCIGDSITPNTDYSILHSVFHAYDETDNDASSIHYTGYFSGLGGAGQGKTSLCGSRWNNTAAITSLEYYTENATDFAIRSWIFLYYVPKAPVPVLGYVKLDEDTSSVVFDDLPTGAKGLTLTVYARSDRANTADAVYLEFNSDSAAGSYGNHLVAGSGGGVLVSLSTGKSAIRITGDTEGANEFGGGYISLQNHTTDGENKNWIAISKMRDDWVEHNSLLYKPTGGAAPITKIECFPQLGSNFKAGSFFQLTAEY